MAIVPVVFRRRLLARANFVGGPLVHLLAFVFQPAAYLKRMSRIRGVQGSSMVWKLVAILVHAPAIFKSVFGKSTEVVDVSRLGTDRFMTVTTAKPMTRRRRRKLRKQGIVAPTLKDHRAYAAQWAAKADAARRAS